MTMKKLAACPSCHYQSRLIKVRIIGGRRLPWWWFIECDNCHYCGETRLEQFSRWPKYKLAYIRAFDKMLEKIKAAGKTLAKNWQDGRRVVDWWING